MGTPSTGQYHDAVLSLCRYNTVCSHCQAVACSAIMAWYPKGNNGWDFATGPPDRNVQHYLHQATKNTGCKT
eukprot:365725-Chlamydomonas_euryale.AAC.31